MGTFMIGNPYETIQDIEMTKDFIIRNEKNLDFIGAYIHVPMPNTEVWDLLGLNAEKIDWEEFLVNIGTPEMNYLATNTVTREEIKKAWGELQFICKRKYPIKEIITRSIKRPERVIEIIKSKYQS